MKSLKKAGFLLLLLVASRGTAQLNVNTNIEHIKPDGLDSLGNIILNVSGGTPPYFYNWSAGYYPRLKDRTDVQKNLYSVKVKDSGSDSILLSYNLGYKVNWADFNQIFFRNDSLLVGESSGGMNLALSASTLRQNVNGWTEFIVRDFREPYFIGFSHSDEINLSDVSDVTCAFHLTYGNALYAYYSGFFTFLKYVEPGDIIKMERQDGIYNIYQNNEIVYSAAAEQGVSLKLKAQINTDLLMDMGCSFSDATHEEPLSVQGVLKHLSQEGTYSDGQIVLKVNGGSSPYTYAWEPASSTSNFMNNATYGNYNVTVTDYNGNSVGYSYNVGYKVSWDKFNGTVERNDSLLALESFNDHPSALSVNRLKANANGWVEYVLDPFSTPYVIGLLDSASVSNSGSIYDIDFAFHLSYSNALYAWSAGGFSFLGYASVGDVLRLGRNADGYYIMRNGTVINTQTTAVRKELKIKAQLNGDLFLNLGSSFTLPLAVDYNQKNVVSENEPNSGYIYLNPKFGLMPYRFKWNDNSTGNSLTDLGIGTYTVMVVDSLRDTVKLSFNIGNELKWINIKNMNINGQGDYVITEPGRPGTATLDKYIPASQNGFYEFKIPNVNNNFNFVFQPYDTTAGLLQQRAVLVRESVVSILRTGLPAKGTTEYNLINFADTITTGDYANVIQKEFVSDTCLTCDHLNIAGIQLDYGKLYYFSNGITIKKGSTVINNDILKIESSSGSFNVSVNNTELYSESFSNGTPLAAAGTFNGPAGPSDSSTSVGTTASSGGITNTSSNVNVSANEGCTMCSADYGMNSIETVSYNELATVISWSKVYYDRRGEVKQSQVKNITENKIIVSQSLYDAYGRKVAESLPAPINEICFCYQSGFITSPGTSNPYTYNDFDKPNYTSNALTLTLGERDKPNAVNNTIPYSLGWYYSDNNTLEKYVPAASTPYSRVVYSTVDPSSILKSSKPGDKLNSGSNHEAYNFKMATMGELNHVFGPGLGWRIDEFTDFYDNDPCSSILIPAPLANTAPSSIKSINVDENGTEIVNFMDITGNLVATCLAGKVNGANVKTQRVKGWLSFTDETQRYIDVHLPDGCENSLSISAPVPDYGWPYPVYNIIDLKTGEYMKFAGSVIDYGGVNSSWQPNLPPGYYRIVVKSYSSLYNISVPAGGGGVNVVQDLNYYNFSLNFYDYANRLKSIVSPKGFDDSYVYSTQPGFSNPSYRVKIIDSGSNNPNYFPAGKSWSLGDGDFIDKINLDLPASEVTDNVNLSITFDNKTANAKGEPAGMSFDDDRILDPGTASANYDYPEYPIDTTGNALAPPTINAAWVENVHFKVKIGLLDGENSLIESSVQESSDLVCNIQYSDEGDQYVTWSPLTFKYNQQFLNMDGTGLVTATKIQILALEPEEASLGEDYSTYADLVNDLVVTASGSKLVGVGTSNNSYPQHKMIERYRYDSWDNLLSEISPDKGRTDYNYRQDGQLKFTQNAKQKALNSSANYQNFRITDYDNADRLIIDGTTIKTQTPPAPNPSPFSFLSYDDATAYTSLPTLCTLNKLDFDFDYPAYPNYANDCIGIYYDAYDPQFQNVLANYNLNVNIYTQRHLDGRVSHTFNYDKQTWYSYDEQGRVEWVVQKYLDLNPSPNADLVKTFQYRYDASGNISEMLYNAESSVDGLNHFYEYDQDNRLKRVYTQRQSVVPILPNPKMLQAKYDYYLHGPLKRTELGDKMQGQDFVYTITGALKSMNGAEMDAAHDPGKDGDISTTTITGAYKDLFGLSLDYYNGDYQRSGTNIQSYNDVPGTYLFAPDQFNGVIKGQRWQTRTPSSVSSFLSYANKQLMYGYQYDKKSQLLDAKFAEVTSNGTQNILQPSNISNTNDYRVYNLSYDYNGNMLSLKRNTYASSGYNLNSDDLTYNYYPCKNSLSNVSDAVATNPYGTLEFKPGQTTYNYAYTAIGELAVDLNNLKSYEYNDRGNITVIKDQANNVIAEYSYDEMGYRIQKAVYVPTNKMKYTFYVRDAAGNIISTFEKTVPFGASISFGAPTEWNIYSGNRIGTLDNTSSQENYIYELTDHLGNVRSTFKPDVKTTIVNDFNSNVSTNDDNWFNNPNNTITNSFDININGSPGNYFVRTQKSTGKEYGAGAKMIPVKNGNNITISWNALWETGTVPSAGVEIKLTDANGNQLNGANGLWYYAMSSSGGPNSWQNYSQTITMPTFVQPTAMYLSIYPRNKDNTGAVAFFDNFNITFNSGNVSEPALLNIASYYPHGSVMPGLNYNTSYKYKYGYQGQFAEMDDESNETSFELRNYNSLIGRFSSTDPYDQYYSPYMAMGNSHPNQVDPDGGNSPTGGMIGATIGFGVGCIVAGTNAQSKSRGLGTVAAFTAAGYLIGSGNWNFASSVGSFGLNAIAASVNSVPQISYNWSPPSSLYSNSFGRAAQSGGGTPKNAQEVFLSVLSMKLKVGQTVDGSSLSEKLDGISLIKFNDGYNIKINSYFKEKAAQLGGFDPNNRFTISPAKWVDGKTDIIKYQERYKGKWGLTQHVHNDGVKYFFKINEESYPFKFGNQYRIGNGKW